MEIHSLRPGLFCLRHLLHFLKRFYLFIFREREREGKHQCVAACRVLHTGDLVCNLGTCPDWESNWWPFGLQVSTQSTEPHQPGGLLLLHSPAAVTSVCTSISDFIDVSLSVLFPLIRYKILEQKDLVLFEVLRPLRKTKAGEITWMHSSTGSQTGLPSREVPSSPPRH